MSDSPTIGILGLGIMGSAYARHLAAAGHPVIGYDPVPSALAALAERSGRAARSAREVAAEADLVLIALPSVSALKTACLDSEAGLVAGIEAGKAVVEMSTLPIAAKEECRAALAARGAAMLDCPVSGTGAQAASRDIVLYASGDASVTERWRAVLECFAREVRHVGPFGAGMQLKCVANLLVTIHNLASAEAMLLAESFGLDLDLAYDAIRSGAGTSRIFELRAPMMIAERYTPATMKMGVHMKDIAIIREEAASHGCPTPLLDASLPLYEAALADGRESEDTAALFEVLRDRLER